MGAYVVVKRDKYGRVQVPLHCCKSEKSMFRDDLPSYACDANGEFLLDKGEPIVERNGSFYTSKGVRAETVKNNVKYIETVAVVMVPTELMRGRVEKILCINGSQKIRRDNQ